MSNRLVTMIFTVPFFLIIYFFVDWLFDFSFWQNYFLAALLSYPLIDEIINDIKGKIEKINSQIQMLNDEVMRLTSIIENNESKIDSVEDIDRRLSNLEYRFRES